MRGNNKSYIFKDQNDKAYFLKVLKHIEGEGLIKVAAWCIMDNHVHLVMKVDQDDLTTAMKRINIKFAMHYQKEHGTVGHVFQDRFKSEVIESDEYMMMAIRYIHNNPVKAKMVTSPKDYSWSSYNSYMNESDNINTEMYQFVMTYFHHKEKTFIDFHKLEDEYTHLEIKEDQDKYRLEKAQLIIQKYCQKYGIVDRKELEQQTDILEEMIREIKKSCHLSLRKLSGLTEISVTRLHGIVKRR
jgi:REP element-mobilizing transposase RayT